jgi:hypothetical protein
MITLEIASVNKMTKAVALQDGKIVAGVQLL